MRRNPVPALPRPPVNPALGHVVFALALVVGAAQARADATLAGLVEASLAVRPELAEAEAQVRAGRERVPQAGALADPMVQLGLQNDGFTRIELGRMEGSYVSLMASQAFPWGGIRDLRREVASLSATRAEQTVTRWRLSTEAEVRRNYLELLLVRDRRALLDLQEKLSQRALAVARIRYEAGSGLQSDFLRAQLEFNRLGLRRSALLAEERSRLQALNRLRAHPLDENIETSVHVSDLPRPVTEHDFSGEQARARSPELAAARIGLTEATRTVELGEKGYTPEVIVGAGFMFRGQLPPMWLVTLGSTLPVYADDKQDRVVAEGNARRQAAEKSVSALERLLTLRSAERRSVATALQDTLQLYAQGLLVQAEAAAESTLSQFQVGRGGFGAVLEANTGFVADQEGQLQTLAALQRLVIDEAEVSLAAPSLPTGSGAGSGAGAMAGGAPASPGAGPSMSDPGDATNPTGAPSGASGM